MADTETLTDATVPTPTEVAEAPKTEVVETSATETKSSDETDAEARTEETKPEVPEIDPYDELEHERFKSVLESRDRRNDERVRADYQRQYEEATGNWKATQAHDQLASIYGNILQKLEESDTETVGKLVGRLEQAVEPYSESYKKGLQAEGKSEAATELYGAVTGSLDHRGQDELQDYLATTRNASWGDVLKKRDEIREGKSKKSNSDEVTFLKAQLEGLKAKVRPDGPDDAPKDAGGGKKYLDMTREERDALSNEERDRLTATQ